jgi:hypothetical protein
MTRWNSLKIGSFNCKITPLNPIEKEYPNVDENGNALKYVSGKLERGYFTDENGVKVEKAFKLINGKVVDKLKRTDEVKIYKEVDKDEQEDLIAEKEYLVECDNLVRQLSDSEKILKFAYASGNGNKAYITYVYLNPLYREYAFMKLGRTFKSQIILFIDEVKANKSKLKEVELVSQKVARADVSDLIEI